MNPAATSRLVFFPEYDIAIRLVSRRRERRGAARRGEGARVCTRNEKAVTAQRRIGLRHRAYRTRAARRMIDTSRGGGGSQDDDTAAVARKQADIHD